MMIDVLLLIPPYYYKSKVLTSGVKEYAGVEYLASVLRQHGYSVEILDADLAGYDVDTTVSEILKRKAKVIGITVLQVAIVPVLQIIKELRKAGVESFITIGGHFPTFAWSEILKECPEIDCIVLGEGEYTLLDIVNAVDSGKAWKGIAGIAYKEGHSIAVNKQRPLISDLDSLPFQSRDTLKEVLRRGGSASLISSRGCYGNCSFCSVGAFYRSAPGPSWRGRSPEHIASELDYLVSEMGVRIIVFNDDNFIGPGKSGKERAYAIGEEILKRGFDIKFAIPAAPNDVEPELFRHLKKAGLSSVFLGIESMNPTDLSLLNKHVTVEQNEKAISILEDLGIFYQIGFIMFNPHSTLDDVKNNINIIRGKILKNDYCGTQVFTGDLRILQGTLLENFFKDKEGIRKEQFHYTYKISDLRVEKLREIADHIILKKTFPLIVDCKEEFMVKSWQKLIRTDICDLQLAMLLLAIEYMEKGGIGFEGVKDIIRKMDEEIVLLKEKVERLKKIETGDFYEGQT